MSNKNLSEKTPEVDVTTPNTFLSTTREKTSREDDAPPPNFEDVRLANLLKGREAKKTATPKKVYADAIQAFCEECQGIRPSHRDCGEINCHIYPVNTWAKRRKNKKTTLRKIIKAECRTCLSTPHLESCTSPNCALNPFGPGGK